MDNYENEIDSQNYNMNYKNRDLNFYSNKNSDNNKNKYNDFNEEDYDYNKDNTKDKQRYNNINSKYNYKNRKNNESNQEEEFNIKKNYEVNNYKNYENNNLNREQYKDDIKANNKIGKKENEYITIVTEKEKIIGCDKEKMQNLINNREYQIVEKELSVLIKEKDKLEGNLLKMPEHPRKLNDIRNKKEINDIIERIESDISFIRTMLKRTNDYYIKKI